MIPYPLSESISIISSRSRNKSLAIEIESYMLDLKTFVSGLSGQSEVLNNAADCMHMVLWTLFYIAEKFEE